MKFNKLYFNLVEDIFKPATPEEIEARKKQYTEIAVKEWVEEFLKRSDIKKNSDGSYDVEGDVKLYDLKLTKIPIKFNKVNGTFDCSDNKLTSLEGAPKVVGGSFWCDNNTKQFTEEEVRAVCEVKGKIYV